MSCIVDLLCKRFPISRDPPEGGTVRPLLGGRRLYDGFQFLGIPPKGERAWISSLPARFVSTLFPISRDPPEGGTIIAVPYRDKWLTFPISRDPPEGGTSPRPDAARHSTWSFPISRDPPEGGTGGVYHERHEVRRKFPISRDPPEGGTRLD